MRLSRLVAMVIGEGVVLAVVLAVVLGAVLNIALCGTVSAATSDDALAGVWSYATSFGPALQGELTIERRHKTWRATAKDVQTEFTPHGNHIEFSFPNNTGKFRGRITDAGIHGFWIRPAATKDPRFPGGSSQEFATPLDLPQSGKNTYSGILHPLANPFTLYLKIFRGEDGALMAAFRNPEQNSRGPSSLYHVALDGDEVLFTAGTDPAATQYRLTAKYLEVTDQLAIDWPDAGGEILLARQTPQEAARFFPRPPGSAPYDYRQPSPGADGWDTARAADLGLDESALTHMVQSIIDGDPAASRPALIHSMLVAYRGKLVLEEYFFGFDRDQAHDLRSAGKTFSSVLLGAAIKDGVDIGPDTKIYPLMAVKGPFANPDPRKAGITLAQLLTHSAGLACDDNDDTSPGNENTMQLQTSEPDWWKYTLDLPMAHDPGTRYAYCSANINLVGGALTTATGTWLPELFEEKIARPLQFGEWHWNLMPNGEGYLGGGVFVRPRDLLKIGQVYLDGGAWKGQRIVDAAWVTESTLPRITISPETTGLSAEEFQNSYFAGQDALGWHDNGVHAGERRYTSYAATGNGGQLLIVVPQLQLAVVFTGGNYMQGGIWGRWADQFIGGFIIPGI